MPDMYKSDESSVHQDFIITAEKKSPEVWAARCFDTASIKVHTKQEAQRLVDVLKGFGFAVQLDRRTRAILQKDIFPSEEEEEEEEEETKP